MGRKQHLRNQSQSAPGTSRKRHVPTRSSQLAQAPRSCLQASRETAGGKYRAGQGQRSCTEFCLLRAWPTPSWFKCCQPRCPHKTSLALPEKPICSGIGSAPVTTQKLQCCEQTYTPHCGEGSFFAAKGRHSEDCSRVVFIFAFISLHFFTVALARPPPSSPPASATLPLLQSLSQYFTFCS